MAASLIRVRIVEKRPEAEGICSMRLVRTDGEPLPAFTAGAHVDLLLPGGLMRQYSLCGDPADRDAYRLAVLREPASRGGSSAVHDVLATGDLVEISEPRNHFTLVEEVPVSLLVAGGIGITPLLAMARRLSSLGRPYELHYCTRSRAHTAFAGELAEEPLASHAVLYFDDDGPRFDPTAMLARHGAAANVYVCGPSGFITFVEDAARAASIPAGRIHREHFSNTNAVSAPAAGSFTIELHQTGRTLEVPVDKSVVQVLREAGIDVQTSCEEGVCGTCLTRVLEGVPDHRDAYLTDEERAENDQFLPCCSRSTTNRLVLDL